MIAIIGGGTGEPAMTATDPIESHAVHSRRMLEHAAEMIAQGDRLQASEKIWGAAVHQLKKIAQERGWPYDSHADGTVIARHIAQRTDTSDIAIRFGFAVETHQNFYEDRMSLEELTARLGEIATLLELLDEAHRALPPDLAMPDDRHYRRRHG